MASKTVVELVDDLDGGRADETVNFALDGVEYVIDLSTEHATRLRDALAEFIGHASKVSRRARRAASNGTVVDTEEEFGDEIAKQINRARRLGAARAKVAKEQNTETPEPDADPSEPAKPAGAAKPVTKPLAVAELPTVQPPVDDKAVADPLFSRKADATDAPNAPSQGTSAALIVPFKAAGS